MSKIETLITPGNVSPQQVLLEALSMADDGGFRSVAVVFETPKGDINALYSTQNVADLALKSRILEIKVDTHFIGPREG